MAASAVDTPRTLASRLRTYGAVAATAIWGAAVVWFFWDEPKKLEDLWDKPHDLAEFVAGAAGPLALLWLIVGYFQQSEELELQRKELKLQRHETAKLAKEAEKQATAVENSEALRRRDVVLRIYDVVIVGQRAAAKGLFWGGELNFSKHIHDLAEKGDPDAYFYGVVIRLIREPSFFASPRNARADHFHAESILTEFESFCVEADAADPAGYIRRIVENSAWATCYMAICFRSHRTPSLKWRRPPGTIEELEIK
jgi:hypothetical protein